MKAVKAISIFLGVSMFMFGILKFVNPFKGWYAVQVAGSGLGEFAYWLGIAGEISVGIIFLGCMGFREKLRPKMFNLVIFAASATVMIMMATGIYVHLHPGVPAEVLPLKIKPPFIPAFFLLLALTNIALTLKKTRYTLAK